MSRRLKVSVEEKMRCIKSYMSGKGNLETIAGRAGVDEKSLRNWIKRYKAGGVEALYPAKQNRVYSSELKQKAVSAPVRFCNFSPNGECKKMAGKGVQPLNDYTCRFRPSSLKCTDKSGLDGLQADK